jgi:hypothetical protein
MKISNSLLAYETGVHLGDGNLTFKKEWNLYRTTYAGNSIEDRDFFVDLLPKILVRLYAKTPRIYFPKNENTVLVVLNSKEVAQFKMKLGLPSGNKNQILNFPEELKKNNPLLLLRGLADTDFCVNFRDLNGDWIKEHPRIYASFSNIAFTNEISKILNGIEIKHRKRSCLRRGKYVENKIEIEGKKAFELWCEKIGFPNPKFINKIKRFNPEIHINSKLDI